MNPIVILRGHYVHSCHCLNQKRKSVSVGGTVFLPQHQTGLAEPALGIRYRLQYQSQDVDRSGMEAALWPQMPQSPTFQIGSRSATVLASAIAPGVMPWVGFPGPGP